MRILEARIEFSETGSLSRVTVLADFSSSRRPLTDVRAIYSERRVMSGYLNLPNRPIDALLINQVAELGREAADRDEIFPGWKEKYNKAD